MSHAPLILVCFLCMPFILISQDISHYTELSKTQLSPSQKLTVLDSIASKSYMINDAVFIENSIEYFNLALKQNEHNKAAEKAIKLQKILSSKQKKPRKAIAIINRILASKYKLTDSFLIGQLYYQRARAHSSFNLKQAVIDYQLSIEHYAKDDHNNKGYSYLYLGHTNSDLGNFIESSINYKNAYLEYEAINSHEFMLYAQSGYINMYSLNGFFDKAKEERDKYLESSIEYDFKIDLAGLFYNQALDYRTMKKYDLQIQSLKTALGHLNSSSSDLIRIGIHGQLLEYYAITNKYNKAKEQFDILESLKEDRIAGNLIHEMLYYSAIGFFYHKFDTNEKALEFASKCRDIALKLGHKEEIKDSYFLLSQIYQSLEDYKEAFETQKKYTAIKDSIFNKNKAFTLAYYQTQYKTEKREKELVKKNKDIELLESENQSFKKQVVFISISTIFLFGVFLLFRNQKHLRQNKVLQEKFSQELIVSQENERIRISKDLHDGIGQQLLLIKNKLIGLGNTEAKLMVDNAIDEVRTISRDLHPFHLQEMGITKAIKNALISIDENTTLFISSEIDDIDNLFTPEQEVNIYRIVQEALNNIIKHASAEASKVSVMKLSKLIVITIKDNGTGFDFNDKFQNIKSMGLKTLLERTKFLNGQMKVQSIKNNGTLIEFQIPIKG